MAQISKVKALSKMSDSHQHFHQKTSKTPKHKNTFVKTCSLNNSEGKNLKWQLIEKILTEYLNIRRPGFEYLSSQFNSCHHLIRARRCEIVTVKSFDKRKIIRKVK